VSTPSEPTLPPHSEAFLAEINAQLKQQLNATTKELEYARLKIQLLEERLRLRRIEKYGPGSEKLSNLQLELLDTDYCHCQPSGCQREPANPPPRPPGNRHRIRCDRARDPSSKAPLPPRPSALEFCDLLRF